MIDVVALIASELSTPVDTVESWPLEKTARYYDAAVRLIKAKAGSAT